MNGGVQKPMIPKTRINAGESLRLHPRKHQDDKKYKMMKALFYVRQGAMSRENDVELQGGNLLRSSLSRKLIAMRSETGWKAKNGVK